MNRQDASDEEPEITTGRACRTIRLDALRTGARAPMPEFIDFTRGLARRQAVAADPTVGARQFAPQAR